MLDLFKRETASENVNATCQIHRLHCDGESSVQYQPPSLGVDRGPQPSRPFSKPQSTHPQQQGWEVFACDCGGL